MVFDAKLKISDHASALYDCLRSEEHTLDRASVHYHLEDNVLIIEMVCQDATALRACMNTVTRLLTVFEKVATYGHGNDKTTSKKPEHNSL